MTSARTNANWARISAHGADLLGAHTPAGARLAAMGRFFGQLSDDMAGGHDPGALSVTLDPGRLTEDQHASPAAAG